MKDWNNTLFERIHFKMMRTWFKALGVPLVCAMAFGVAAQEADSPAGESGGPTATEDAGQQAAAPSAGRAKGGSLPMNTIILKAGNAQAGKKLAVRCAACHGPTGNSTNPAWPKLASQNADYLYAELKAFKSGKRQAPIMNAQAASLTEQEMANLAVFYSKQTIKPGVADPELVEKGEEIYKGGLPEKNVPACIACHGPAGQGIAGASFPAVAGQHAQYSLAELKAFASGKRQSKAGIMNFVASNLTVKQMKAVASYMQGLHVNEGVFQIRE